MSRPTHVVSYSGGVTSWAAAKVVKDEGQPMVLLFADTRIEHPDTYRFLREGAEVLGEPVTRIADGRTPWEVFRTTGFIGNSRIDPCSRILKRDLMKKWHEENYPDPESMVIVVGLDAFEEHRFKRFADRSERPVRAPLVELGLTKRDAARMAEEAGIGEQWLYKQKFSHANCGGACVKAGISAWVHTYRKLPGVFAEWERQEAELGAELKAARPGHREFTILTDRRGGTRKSLSLRQLRERIERRPELLPEEPEIGGCGCAIE